MAKKREPPTTPGRGPRRRPFLHWRTVPLGEGLLPHDLEADATLVLVALMEWAAHVGVDFEAVLRRAREALSERAGQGAP